MAEGSGSTLAAVRNSFQTLLIPHEVDGFLKNTSPFPSPRVPKFSSLPKKYRLFQLPKMTEPNPKAQLLVRASHPFPEKNKENKPKQKKVRCVRCCCDLITGHAFQFVINSHLKYFNLECALF